ncbi:hypothetical protein JCM10207_001539 [Rhodosporidiobolus poonsookiae]
MPSASSTSTPSLSAGSHNVKPPSSTVSIQHSDSQFFSSKLGDTVGGTAEEAKGKLSGNEGAIEEGRAKRQSAGKRRGED